MILRNLPLCTRHREFPAPRTSLLPNLIQEIAISDAMENQLGRSCRFVAVASIGKSNLHRLVLKVLHANGHAVAGQGFQCVLARGISMVGYYKVERNICPHAGLLRLSG